MPHAIMTEDEVPAVTTAVDALEEILLEASKVKPVGTIEPALTPFNLPAIDRKFGTNKKEMLGLLGFQEHNVVERAFAKIFLPILTSTSIDDPSFGVAWNLIDIATIFADRDQSASQLAFWLIEEIFESRTVEDCKKVFDYLESRRERMVAESWERKNQVVLRACNDLLRRLSHGEDTLFYGRVLIYLFRCFPLCHRGAINLRGEFHVDNTTVFDTSPAKPPQDDEAMEVDKVEPTITKENSIMETKVMVTPVEQTIASETAGENTTAALQEEKKSQSLDLDDLYGVFWSLQNYFSRPTQLFDPNNFDLFKKGLEATMTKFKEVQKEEDARTGVKTPDEPKQGTKRKREVDHQTLIGEVNPKYLTSRDLFALEISDLAFRRHILVQAWIIIEFLLSLTPKVKAKVAHLIRNKGVTYNFVLPDEEAQWAQATRTDIVSYLRSGADGTFYHRAVDTVLSRDKNWSYWKSEACPQFSLPPVPASTFLAAVSSAKSISTTKRLRSTPMGAFDISFLAESDGTKMLETIRDPVRGKCPPLGGFEKEIQGQDLDLEMEEEGSIRREILEDRRKSLVWQALRVGSKERLKRFGQIDDGRNIRALFRGPESEGSEGKMEGVVNGEVTTPKEGAADTHMVDTTSPSQKDHLARTETQT